MTPVFQRPQAERDALDLAEFIAQDDFEAGERFLASVEKSYDLLARFPDLGTAWRTRRPKFPGLRWSPVQGFSNHLIFYFHRNDLPAQWSLQTGGDSQDGRFVTRADLWLGSRIRLDDVRIPENVEAASGGEIERFVAERKKKK